MLGSIQESKGDFDFAFLHAGACKVGIAIPANYRVVIAAATSGAFNTSRTDRRRRPEKKSGEDASENGQKSQE